MPTVSGLEIVGAARRGRRDCAGRHDADDDHWRLDPSLPRTASTCQRNRNLLLADSHIYDGVGPAIGVFFDGVNLHQSIIVGCHISYCRHAGIKSSRSEVRNLQITGNDIEYNFDPDATRLGRRLDRRSRGAVREGTIASNTIQAKRSPDRRQRPDRGPRPARLPPAPASGRSPATSSRTRSVNLWLRSCRGVTLTGNSFASGFERSLVARPLPAHRRLRQHLRPQPRLRAGPHRWDHRPRLRRHHPDRA